MSISKRQQYVLALIATFALQLQFGQARAADEDAEAKKEPSKTVEVKARDLTLNVPESWKQEEPTSSLRLTQFQIPASEGDKEAAELTVFNFGGGGSVEDNVKRWINQFEPKDREVKILTGDGRQGKYILTDISGTYNKPDGPPILRKTIPASNYRVMSVILVIEMKGVYYLKVTGPKKTVSDARKAFRESFGASDEEKEIKPDE